jgi:hypothetical protein
MRAMELEELPKEIPMANRSPAPEVSSLILKIMRKSRGNMERRMEEKGGEDEDSRQRNSRSIQSTLGRKKSF